VGTIGVPMGRHGDKGGHEAKTGDMTMRPVVRTWMPFTGQWVRPKLSGGQAWPGPKGGQHQAALPSPTHRQAASRAM
jgi:hypothetical protein